MAKTKQVKIGFLGDGQLARMMVLEAHRLGLEPHVLTENPHSPAAQTTCQAYFGKLQDIKALQAFAEKVDYLTFESEFVPASALSALESLPAVKVFPKISTMKTLQNRLSQKQMLEKFKIPTAPFFPVIDPSDLEPLWQAFDGPFVIKKNFGGYDGYGTFFARKISDLKDLAETLKPEAQGYLAEKMIPFQRELAAILIRSQKGQTLALPLVETKQLDGKCDWVQGPIRHARWPALSKKLFRMMKALDYVGCLGVEMFDEGPRLWINELAPRVHNSGHYSQDALLESQFSLHLLAGLGAKLPPIHVLSPHFVMANLIGGDGEGRQGILSGKLHLYGKIEARPGRKMGHINYLGAKGSNLLSLALKERKKFLA
jgi:5-(carboxyamino)imidazole ribonucleotide synthase